LQTCQRGDAGKEVAEDTQDYNVGGVFSSNLTIPGMSFAGALRGKMEEQHQPRTHQVAIPDTMEQKTLRLHPKTNSKKQVSQLGP
jgi:hypothetical protein